MHRAASALALGSTFRSRLSTLGVAVANDNLSRSTTSTLFARRRITLDSLAAESDVASKLPLDELPAAVRKLRGHERRVREVLETAIEDARAKIAKIDRTEGTADVEVERARSQDKDRLQSRANDLRRRLEPLYDLQELLEGAEGVLASENRTMFLRGELGDRQDPLPV